MTSAQPPILDGNVFDVDGVGFSIDYLAPSTAERLSIRKPLGLVNAYPRLIEQCRPATIVELGVDEGGSTAFLALLAKPHRLVALELKPEPVPGLAAFIEEQGLADQIRPFYGIDQSDRARIAEIVDRELGDEPIDLVIDDASHLLDETRASFETLFPRMRAGGLYVIEDWASHHVYADAVVAAAAADAVNPSPPQRPTLAKMGRNLHVDQPERYVPLSRLIIQLLLARATSGDAIADLSIDGDWVTVRRGPGHLDREAFRVTDLYTDHFSQTG